MQIYANFLVCDEKFPSFLRNFFNFFYLIPVRRLLIRIRTGVHLVGSMAGRIFLLVISAIVAQISNDRRRFRKILLSIFLISCDFEIWEIFGWRMRRRSMNLLGLLILVILAWCGGRRCSNSPQFIIIFVFVFVGSWHRACDSFAKGGEGRGGGPPILFMGRGKLWKFF